MDTSNTPSYNSTPSVPWIQRCSAATSPQCLIDDEKQDSTAISLSLLTSSSHFCEECCESILSFESVSLWRQLAAKGKTRPQDPARPLKSQMSRDADRELRSIAAVHSIASAIVPTDSLELSLQPRYLDVRICSNID